MKPAARARKKQQLLQAADPWISAEYARLKCGVTHRTLYRWLAEDPEFHDAFYACRDRRYETDGGELVAAVREDFAAASRVRLESARLRAENYLIRQEQELIRLIRINEILTGGKPRQRVNAAMRVIDGKL